MKVSQKGLELIKDCEGCVLHLYDDAAGLATIGCGHLVTEAEKASGRFAHGITEQQALDLLRVDVAQAERAVNDLVRVSLTQDQFDVLVDFTFNLGRGALQVSTLLKKLNAGDHAAVPAELMKWNKVRNPRTKQLEPSRGITLRRQREADMWSA